MHHIIRCLCLSLGLSLLSTPLYAGGHGKWVLDAEKSKVAYASIKKNAVGEVNHFKAISGEMSSAGDVKVTIDLSSVETFIGIRNERMIKHVFSGPASKAVLTASVDSNVLKSLAVGDTASVDVSGTLAVLGKTIEIDTTMVVAKLAKNRVMAVTDEMIIVKTADLGIDAGIDKLKELAKLPGITRVVPVSLRFIFESSHKHAAAPAKSKKENIASAGNPAAGKKLYRQCLGCHNVKKEDNGVGPHLVGIIGRKAGDVAGFDYSKAMKNANLVWTKENLTAFMMKPAKTVPGNTMPFPGVANADDIEHILAYLESLQK